MSVRLVNLLNSEWIGIASYVVAAVACICAGQRERHAGSTPTAEVWPWFWTLAGGSLVLMAVARIGRVGGRLYFVGRREAEAGGWYGSRRPLQAFVVAILAVVALAIVIVGVRRIGVAGRRYAPTLVMLFGLFLFSLIRIVSLHQIDSVLYRHPIHGVRVGPVLDLFCTGLLLVAIRFGHVDRGPLFDTTRRQSPSIPDYSNDL